MMGDPHRDLRLAVYDFCRLHADLASDVADLQDAVSALVERDHAVEMLDERVRHLEAAVLALTPETEGEDGDE